MKFFILLFFLLFFSVFALKLGLRRQKQLGRVNRRSLLYYAASLILSVLPVAFVWVLLVLVLNAFAQSIYLEYSTSSLASAQKTHRLADARKAVYYAKQSLLYLPPRAFKFSASLEKKSMTMLKKAQSVQTQLQSEHQAPFGIALPSNQAPANPQ